MEQRQQELLAERMAQVAMVPEVSRPTMFLLVGEVAHRELHEAAGRPHLAQALIM